MTSPRSLRDRCASVARGSQPSAPRCGATSVLANASKARLSRSLADSSVVSASSSGMSAFETARQTATTTAATVSDCSAAKAPRISRRAVASTTPALASAAASESKPTRSSSGILWSRTACARAGIMRRGYLTRSGTNCPALSLTQLAAASSPKSDVLASVVDALGGNSATSRSVSSASDRANTGIVHSDAGSDDDAEDDDPSARKRRCVSVTVSSSSSRTSSRRGNPVCVVHCAMISRTGRLAEEARSHADHKSSVVALP
mmetsp:Transcript_8511/g.35012  ORF Transcript_8511/g.35012 Transcript_8511/m.35012 type:complete len:261 (-) Transcript_8511:1532-2314(-)